MPLILDSTSPNPDIQSSVMAKDYKPLLPAIVVLNRRYLITGNSAAAKVGAAAFAASVVQAFVEKGIFLGMILYQRDEDIVDPYISSEAFSSISTVTVSFNFHMDPSKVANALLSCIRILKATNPMEGTPMLYYQTDTLMEYHPRHIPSCVTHHGPFFGSFASIFSKEAAALAFGSMEKAEHLERQQDKGIEIIKSRENAFVLQHSQLQGNFLASRGVTALRELCPPIELLTETEETKDELPENITEWFNFDGVVMFTAVARLDYFKNIDLLVDAAILLCARGIPLRVFVAGGEQPDSMEHRALMDKVPPQYQHLFLLVPKVSRSALYSLFAVARHTGIFICPSRYETLGITPLEAALNGVTTVISNSSVVEASRFYPEEFRFSPNPEDLSNLIVQLSGPRGTLANSGDLIRLHVGKSIQGSKFRSDLLDAWSDFSVQYLSTLVNYVPAVQPPLCLETAPQEFGSGMKGQTRVVA
ncbi:hypothetical protein H112_00890 [Trichophyton rubrum D6]|uniref:Glycosyl transferase family 1 domain-containing protein n=4 Tax=Trichophyton TaxID=5550 RepID=A0A178F4I6_TRIRU|nr:uncharacterized protein TERG_07998 [Trichophyton rubrum CBS 118892]EZF27092.1 hypothetical protein H100_00888 [Trichophyton rubrum MR850]EZF46188.1 hypothetical protein H102_00881 [Trichophyton rubrum CBS 100081]EZF56803.1 hypothetical protein H103_00888 [Trichophyton rubrum CBS 288.86]EZF67332.1 hypothetical protein H104_00872 [Trichophyton rubrum CBS 289.86]EZF78045.1 hypothetical protein H105_00887 [Trichophyton soudanense CBS 452.61]EZF88668.1 hypothetical protein H110_00888 [Trichophy